MSPLKKQASIMKKVLKDIQHGMLLSRPVIQRKETATFYTDEPRVLRNRQHWYDEPPECESDPEDFLIGKESRGVRNCERQGNEKEDVISLKTAGDIIVPREPTRARYRGSGDYASSEHGSDLGSDTTSSTERSTIMNKVRGLRKDVQRKLSRLQPPSSAPASTPASAPNSATSRLSHSSVDSYHSESGSSLVAQFSLSGDEPDSVYTGPFIGRARALVDCTPSPYDRHALKFKKGDMVNIISKSPCGTWRGVAHGRVGTFKFISVEVVTEEEEVRRRRRKKSLLARPLSVEDLLRRIGLEEHISVFVLNGYEDLEALAELEHADLDYLGISEPEHRAKILAAIQPLDGSDSDSAETEDGRESSSEGTDGGRSDSSRDTACYDNIHPPSSRYPSDPCDQDCSTYSSPSQAESGFHSSDNFHSVTQSESHPSRDCTADRSPSAFDRRCIQRPEIDYKTKFLNAKSVFECEGSVTASLRPKTTSQYSGDGRVSSSWLYSDCRAAHHSPRPPYEPTPR